MDKTEKLFEFIKKSPSPYHATEAIRSELLANGFTEISERDTAAFSDGGKHFVIRDSSIIAFSGSSRDSGFMICAAHNDSPTFKVKNTRGEKYTSLAVEPYGGLIYYSWLDRPLSIAGRAAVVADNGIEIRLVNIDRDIAVIPSVAIHMNRTVNDGVKLSPAKDMLPIIAADRCGTLSDIIAEHLGVATDEVISHDLYLYLRESPKVFGKNGELILSPRLDDLSCVFASTEAFVSAEPAGVNVLAVFDNEEVGSSTKQGAASTFLHDTLLRIAGSEEKYLEMLTDSFLVSADNAHAAHPNHPELSDPDNSPTLGGGVVIKYNANQKYTTDARSDAIFRTVCKRAGVSVQTYTNRADLPGGSTLGQIAGTKVSVPAVDIGIAQLAMHSSNETMAVSDFDSMLRALETFYSTKIQTEGQSVKII